mmetsp:Transcript_100868/g.262958  ORF Transcript_100868/g.262958 Transcript_100868/m.262958 type:complete len:615 (-) Transcript_100868:200-2044(-)
MIPQPAQRQQQLLHEGGTAHRLTAASSAGALSLAEPVPKLSGRPPMTGCQVFWGLVFYGQLVLTLLLVALVIVGKNVVFPDASGACPADFPHPAQWCAEGGVACVTFPMCTSSGLADKFSHCQLKRLTADDHRPLELVAESPPPMRVWELLAKHVEVPVVVLFGILLLCTVWLALLRVAAAVVIWGTLALNAAAFVYFYYLTQNWMLLVVVAIHAVLCVVRRDAVQMAISATQLSSKALSQTPSIVMVCLALKGVWVIYGLIFMYGMTQMMKNQDIDPDSCNLTLAFPGMMLTKIGTFCFVYTTFFFQNAALAACATGVGAWYFPAAVAAAPAAGNPAVVGATLAFTRSSGAVSVASLIMALVEMAKRYQRKTFKCNPIRCLIAMIWCWVQSIVEALSRFSLVAHMFHGGSLTEAAYKTTDILKRRLSQAVIADSIVHKEMTQISMLLGTAMGFAVWAYLDKEENLGVFAAIGHGAHDIGGKGEQYMIIALILVMLFFVRNPLFTIVVVILINANFSITDKTVNSFSISIFFASISAIIFTYFAHVIACSCDVICYSFAIEAEKGEQQERMTELYDLFRRQAFQADASQAMRYPAEVEAPAHHSARVIAYRAQP